MNLFKSIIVSLTLALCGMSSAYANPPPIHPGIQFTMDFSNVILDVGQNVDWTYYNRWYLGDNVYVQGALASGWFGEPLEELTKAPYVLTAGASGLSVNVLAVGLTDNNGSTFMPSPTPQSCLVTMKNHDVLRVSGTLHIPGNYKEPYIDNLSCTLTH
jgi:hypothetical protein